MEGTPLYLPLTVGHARSLHVRADVTDCHGESVKREDAGGSRHGQNVREKREMIRMKADTSLDDDGTASDDERRKKK